MNVKQAVSISLGSSARDKVVEIELLGQPIRLERRGTDGDMARAKALFAELDGQVDAFGLGGLDLWAQLDGRRYAFRSAHKLIAHVKQTPVVDGGGLKNTRERQVVQALIDNLGPRYHSGKVLLTAAIDRPGMTLAFVEQGYDVVFGDIMFALGLPIAIRSYKTFRLVARLLAGPVTKLPFSMLYPLGDKQDEIIPKFTGWYQWADVIAGDCHFIKRHMPDDLRGTVIVTNTTTPADMELFRQRGVEYVMTTTPMLNGRSFGTNMMEAALTAIAGHNRPLTNDELLTLIDRLDLKPTLHDLTVIGER
jgi:hypothetical protein